MPELKQNVLGRGVLEEKFFYKFLENISRLDESNIKNIVESVERERRIFKTILDLLEEAFIVMDNEKIFYLNQKAIAILRAANLKLPIFIDEAYRFVGNKTLLNFILLIKEKEGYEKSELVEHSNEERFYSVEKFFVENTFYIIKISDITEVKKVEFQLKNIESISALNTLAAGIAHEIKNPLTSIDLHTQIISKKIKNGILNVPDDVKEYIKTVNEEQKRLGKIVNDFLITARKRELKLNFENMNDIILEVIELLKPEFDKENIEVKTNLGKIPKIFVDKDYFKQALINILKNSIEAFNNDKERKLIEVSTFYDKGRDAVGINVKDNGIGIPQDKLQKIFEPYYTTKEYGTGLGLTIVYKIIKEHGGDIKVESEYNKFTSFTLFLPVSRGTKMITK